MIIVKPIIETISDSVFTTVVGESKFYQALNRAESRFNKPHQKKYTHIKSYTEDYIISDSGIPKCFTTECTEYRVSGNYLVVVEKEIRLHNSQFVCHDNYQSILHVDSLSFKAHGDCNVVFELSVNEKGDTHYAVYATGNEKLGINFLENILQ